MAYISYNKLWRSKLDNNVSKTEKLQDLNINQLKLELHDSYKKDEKLATHFEPIINEDVINKAYLDENLLNLNGHLSSLEKNYNEFNILCIKQSVEEVLIQRAVKTTIQVLNDNGFFDNYAKKDEVLEDFLFKTRRRGDLSEQVIDVVQGFCS